MRDESPTLWLRLKAARRLAGVWLLALAGGLLGLDAAAAPAISGISPESGSHRNRVTITGTGFGASRGSSTVTFAGTEASRYYKWSDTEIEVRPPASLGLGASAVVVTVGGEASNGVDYTRLPSLTALCIGSRIAEPSGTGEMEVLRGGPTSEALTVTVTYMGRATPGADFTGPSTLTFEAGQERVSGTLSVIDDAGREGDETIQVRVNAEGYLRGGCTARVVDDDADGEQAPVISRLNPASGGVGATVRITGSHFGATKGTSRVTFNGTAASTTRWSATSIAAVVPVVPVVPAGARTGPVRVTVGGQASNEQDFTVSRPR